MTGPNLILREARREDTPDLARLKHQMNLAEAALLGAASPVRPMLDLSLAAAEAGVADYWRWLETDGGVWHVAERAGRVVGSTLWTRFRASAAYAAGVRDMAMIMAVVVDESERGAGIATALMAAAETSMRSAGIAAASLEVVVDNPAALGLYRRFGFVEREIAMVKPLAALIPE